MTTLSVIPKTKWNSPWCHISHVYSKTCLKRSLKKNTKMIFNTEYRVMQVKSLAECSPWSILLYFRPSLSYHFRIKTFVLYILNDSLRQVLLKFISFGMDGSRGGKWIRTPLENYKWLYVYLKIFSSTYPQEKQLYHHYQLKHEIYRDAQGLH